MAGIIVGVIVAVIVLVLIFVAQKYNQLVKARNNVKNSFAQIDTQLQRRFDLIPNLVEVVKGVSTFEKSLLENISASRSGYMNASTTGEKINMNNQLTSNLKALYAVAENYPNIKSNENFLSLQNELSEAEDKIAYSRQFYNDAVTIYNNKLQMFPSNIIASMFGFTEEELFDGSPEAENVPKVEF